MMPTKRLRKNLNFVKNSIIPRMLKLIFIIKYFILCKELPQKENSWGVSGKELLN